MLIEAVDDRVENETTTIALCVTYIANGQAITPTILSAESYIRRGAAPSEHHLRFCAFRFIVGMSEQPYEACRERSENMTGWKKEYEHSRGSLLVWARLMLES
jgi:hypothetical protein